MGLVERYIFRRLLFSFLVVLGGLTTVIWVVRLIQEVDVVLSQGHSILVFLWISTYGVTPFLVPIMPISLLVGCLHTLSTLNDDSELVVLHSSGFGRSVLLRPFLAVGILCCVTTYILSLWLSPLSMQRLRLEVTDMRSNLVSIILRPGEFYTLDSGVTFHVSERLPGGVLRGILIDDSRADSSATYLADSGTLREFSDEVFLVLSDGEVQRSDGSTITFTSYTYSLSTLSPSRSPGRVGRREVSTDTLLTSPLNSSLHTSRPGYYRAELHSRLTSGIYPLCVILLIVSSLGYPRSSRSRPIATITTISTITILVRILGLISENILHDSAGALYIYLQWGIPLTALLVPSLVMLLGGSLSLPRFVDRAFLGYITRHLRLRTES